jgi:hypothetical protein
MPRKPPPAPGKTRRKADASNMTPPPKPQEKPPLRGKGKKKGKKKAK